MVDNNAAMSDSIGHNRIDIGRDEVNSRNQYRARAVRAALLAGAGTTLLEGLLADQAALHSVLTKIRDLGLPIVSVQSVLPEDEE